jgi:hypothetical protein
MNLPVIGAFAATKNSAAISVKLKSKQKSADAPAA